MNNTIKEFKNAEDGTTIVITQADKFYINFYDDDSGEKINIAIYKAETYEAALQIAVKDFGATL